MFLISDELSDRVSTFAIVIISLLSILFVVLIGLAIHYYPDNYKFFSNYLSDLGMTVTSPHGYDNGTSSLIFTLAMFTAGLLFLLFWIISQNVIRFHVPLKPLFKLLIGIASILGIISSFFSASIGIFHYDTDKSMHLTVGWIFFILASAACIIYGVLFVYLFLKNKSEDKALFWLIVTVVIMVLVAVVYDLFREQNITDQLMILIIWLIIVIMFLNLLLLFKFDSLISYLSYFISFILITAVIVILLLYVTIHGLIPVMEVSFIIVISAFVMTNNLELLKLERKKS